MLIDNLDDLPLARCFEFYYVHELEVKRTTPLGFMSIRMVMGRHEPALPEFIIFHFDQCVEFRTGDIFTLSGQELRIEPKRSPFFEEVHYRVFDSEQDSFEFLCGGFVCDIELPE